MINKFLVSFLFLLPVSAMASWKVSEFTIRGTYIDLVNLTQQTAFEVSGTAAIDVSFTSGHLNVGSKTYSCRSVGNGVLVRGGEPETICNLNNDMFFEMVTA